MDEETPESVWDNISTADLIDQKDYDGIIYHIEVFDRDPELILRYSIEHDYEDIICWINNISDICWDMILRGLSHSDHTAKIIKWYILLSNDTNFNKRQYIYHQYRNRKNITKEELHYLDSLI